MRQRQDSSPYAIAALPSVNQITAQHHQTVSAEAKRTARILWLLGPKKNALRFCRREASMCQAERYEPTTERGQKA
jgi:hypothetical protein